MSLESEKWPSNLPWRTLYITVENVHYGLKNLINRSLHNKEGSKIVFE